MKDRKLNTSRERAGTLWCGLPPMQLVILIVFALALFSVSIFTVTLDRSEVAAAAAGAGAGTGAGGLVNSLRSVSGSTLPPRINTSTSRPVVSGSGIDNSSTPTANSKGQSQGKGVDGKTEQKNGKNNVMDTDKGKAGEDGRSTPDTTSSSSSSVLNLNTYHANTHDQKLSDKRARELRHFKSSKGTGGVDLHFIHIPKCGGTSMTAILRQITCDIDPKRNEDCCTNEGFCDFHAHRRCSSIRGCINHIPQRPWIYKPPPSIILLREPTSRLLSAWFYRCHSPNSDCYQVRPEFKLIHDGKKPKINFDEYLIMPEYNNIQTRMLGADSFPYRNVTITLDIFKAAIDAIDNAYFIGLQEAYDISVKLLLRELNVSNMNKHSGHEISILKERDNTVSKSILKEKATIKGNRDIMNKIYINNLWDIHLYRIAKERFCATVKMYPDLIIQLQETTKVRC